MDNSLLRAAKSRYVVGVIFLFLPSAPLSMSASSATEPRSYRTRVTDSAGRAIAGATVEVYRWQPERPSEMGLATNLITGADGVVEAPWSSYGQLIIRKPGQAPAWREMRPDETNNSPIVLSPPAGLSGVVVDESGKPVSQADVFVSVAHIGARTAWTTLLSARFTRPMFASRTDAQGRFKIENFPTNATAELSVAAPDKVLPPRRVQYSPESLMWRSGQTDIRLKVEPPATITGQVKTESGQPLTNAQVELRATAHSLGVESWERVKGVTNGAFQFTGVGAGAYQLFAQFRTNEAGLPDWAAEPVPVEVRSGEDLEGVVLHAAKGGVLCARSIDRGIGKPLQGIYFTLYLGSDYMHRTSDSNGIGWYRLLPGRYDLHGTSDDGLHQYAQVEIEAGETNEVTLEFSPPPRVGGIVRDAEGQPASGLSVWPVPQLRNEIKTDSNGRYEIVHTENPQVLVVVDSIRNLAVSQEIEEGVTNLDLQLAPALTVSGRVEDTQGKPIHDAKVLPYLRSGTWGFPVSWQRIACDTNGAFKLTALPADRAYYLLVTAPGCGSAQPEVPVDEGNQIELKPIVLTKADKKLAGRVVDAAGTPLARASVGVSGSGQPDVDLETDAEGRFALEVCPGRVHVRVRFQDLQSSVEAAAGDTNLTLVLKPRTANPGTAPLKRVSLVGKPLPSLNTMNLPAGTALNGKPRLLCLFDCEQRPSRQAIRVLTEQNESLLKQGVTVLTIQAAAIASESFNTWTNANPVPFGVGRIAEKTAASKWATETETLPWLILADSQGRVIAEGFGFDEIAVKVSALEK